MTETSLAAEPIPVFKLAKAVGVLAITASAVSAEYGAGINFVSVNSLSVYPDVKGLVPLAMFVCGIAMLPKAWLYTVFSRVMPRAGSKHVWLARSLGLPAGFLITFVYWATGPAGMGVLGYAFGTFLGTAIVPINPAFGHALLSPIGHLITGLAAIWLTFWVNAASIRHYGIFVTILMFVIIAVAALITGYGFATSPATFVAAASKVAKVPLAPPPAAAPASLFHFISVTSLFVFAYAGLGAGPALGGEAAQAERKVPLGIMWGWLVALVLFTAVAAALFHAAPWWAVVGLIKAGPAAKGYATAPGLIGLVAPQWLTVILNLVVALIVGKTLAPALMVTSRYCFAQAQDRMLPGIFAETSSRKVPLAALLLIAGLGSLFLVQSVFAGWAMGVAVRSLAVLGMWLALAIGALNFHWHKEYGNTEWGKGVKGQPLVVPAAILSILLAVPLILSLAVLPKTPLIFQPLFQGAVVLAIGVAILVIAGIRLRSRGESFHAIAAQLPLE
ncbi:MAG TPA: APC family permease [Stellaceae bacterium]|nr:APC family permease [Stellaceae bacterium]